MRSVRTKLNYSGNIAFDLAIELNVKVKLRWKILFLKKKLDFTKSKCSNDSVFVRENWKHCSMVGGPKLYIFPEKWPRLLTEGEKLSSIMNETRNDGTVKGCSEPGNVNAIKSYRVSGIEEFNVLFFNENMTGRTLTGSLFNVVLNKAYAIKRVDTCMYLDIGYNA